MKVIPDSIKTVFFTVLFIFLFFYFFAKVFGPIPFSVNSVSTTKTDLFTVSGDGESSAIPDTALTNFGVTKTSTTVERAKNEVNQSLKGITEGLRNLGIDEKQIKTANYSIYPNYDYANGKNNITGYTATQNIQVEITPIEKANQAVDMAAANGANMLGDIRFTVNDEKKIELENKARENAINKAKEKAITISRASGIRLGKLVNVQESSTDYPRPVYDSLKFAAPGGGDQVQTELQPGENTVSISVTLFYETY